VNQKLAGEHLFVGQAGHFVSEHEGHPIIQLDCPRRGLP